MTQKLPNLSGPLCCRLIGAGGVGQIVATYLVRYLRSLAVEARLVIIDGDDFEPGNEGRMAVPNYSETKAAALAQTLQQTCRGSTVTILAIEQYVRPDNLARLIHGGPGESVLLCVDNHATRKLVGDYCGQLDDICLVSGGNDGVGPDSDGTMRNGTAGNVQVVVRRDGHPLTPGLGDLHPEIASPADSRPDDVGCAELMAAVPQILFTNLTTAAAMLNTWRLFATGELGYSELVFDVQQGLMAPLIETDKLKGTVIGDQSSVISPTDN